MTKNTATKHFLDSARFRKQLPYEYHIYYALTIPESAYKNSNNIVKFVKTTTLYWDISCAVDRQHNLHVESIYACNTKSCIIFSTLIYVETESFSKVASEFLFVCDFTIVLEDFQKIQRRLSENNLPLCTFSLSSLLDGYTVSDVVMYWREEPVVGVDKAELPQFTIVGWETNERKIKLATGM